MRVLSRPAVLSSPHRSLLPAAQRIPHLARFQSTAPGNNQATTASLSPRWLSDLKSRIGRCIQFGLNPEQMRIAGGILEEVTKSWRDLLAGSEGFLTGKGRMGLYRQEVVWGEMDSMGHVNNVVYNRYAESARVNWALNFAAADADHKAEWKELMTPNGIGLILRSIRTDYKFPMTYPDRVTVLHKLKDKPKSDSDHFILDVLILSELHRRPAARCVEDIAVYDYRQARKSAMKPFMVKKLQETYDLQEQAKQTYGNKVLDLLSRVHHLEKSSWDRPDAKEDFGSATNP
ncbi:hypothetical protein K458DRAFT_416776 [Lentithecium fluviatile CBS 122367]|uniref:Thioesterase/thiol ester dehydrase-isomerase n=1 Tax=Lentithecium fluviatile CBS 122367 TaxID=1168545 RepID=A0A6G1J5Q2_9PLEO|nr:hypothetical protein K458DRAFT_416776 [Lentithecium fluviatile CBS 122367]